MAAGVLHTVSDYIEDMRVLLQDTIAPYRYDDDSLLVGLNLAFYEGRRIRPDLFVFRDDDDQHIPYSLVNDRVVHMERAFRLAFVYGACAHALSRDQEDVQDQRANSFYGVFNSILLGVKMAAVQGATPNAQPKGAA